MNQDEISKLQSQLEGAYPTSKISPSKVFDLWKQKKELLEFPNARRADLVNKVLETCREFPSLPQLLAAMQAVVPVERVIKDTCLICDDTGWIHYDADGNEFMEPRYPSGKHIRVKPGKEREPLQYDGKPIMYAMPRPCPSCNH